MRKRFLLIMIAMLAMLGAAAPAAAATETAGAALAGLPSGTTFHIHDRQNQNKCLGIRPSDAFGVIWDCLNHSDQIWRIGPSNPSDSRFGELINNDGLCLGVSAGALDKGAQIRAGRCDATHRDQFWATGINQPGCTLNTGQWVYLINFNSRWIIGVLGGNMNNGTALVQWSQDCHADQLWSGF